MVHLTLDPPTRSLVHSRYIYLPSKSVSWTISNLPIFFSNCLNFCAIPPQRFPHPAAVPSSSAGAARLTTDGRSLWAEKRSLSVEASFTCSHMNIYTAHCLYNLHRCVDRQRINERPPALKLVKLWTAGCLEASLASGHFQDLHPSNIHNLSVCMADTCLK